MKLSRLLLSTLHQCQQSTLWLELILMLDCCLVLCTVQANISSVCCITRILILDSTSIASKRILNIQHLACDGRTVAVLGTSNIDISIYTIYVITFSHINILPSDCVHIPDSSLPILFCAGTPSWPPLCSRNLMAGLNTFHNRV